METSSLAKAPTSNFIVINNNDKVISIIIVNNISSLIMTNVKFKSYNYKN